MQMKDTDLGLGEDSLPDIDWRLVPGGEFLFGRKNVVFEIPDFQISRFPVTHIQFQAFVDAEDGYRDPAWWDGLNAKSKEQQLAGPGKSAFPIPDHPRVNVSWYDAIAFCRWLTAKLGYFVTLPTEPQWEKAARGPQGSVFAYGDTIDLAKGNVRSSGIGMTSPVDAYLEGASPYGLLDMSGNVWEWALTEDDDPSSDFMPSNSRRVLKGGSWSCGPVSSRADGRKYFYRDERYNNVGFRLVAK
jgi:formylglycine-generating enzyme required for sulfatase activity